MSKELWKVGDGLIILDHTKIALGSGLTDGRLYDVVDISDAGNPIITDNTERRLLITGDDFKSVNKVERVIKKADVMEEEYSALRPVHYHEGGIDVFAFIEANWNRDQVAGFYAGNVLKYVLRYRKKNGMEDLEKAEVNLKQLIAWEGKEDAK